MKKRQFGKTDLWVSEVGFGAWAIGGSAMAGNIPLGWGSTDDKASEKAILKAVKQGINFFDTADFYGLGHSEELLGKILGKNKDIIIATKAGHRLDENQSIYFDYSKKYILKACEESLTRLQRDTIDFYQLHTARMNHLKNGECIEAMELLKTQGKIRYWGISLNTFEPFPEAEFMFDRQLGDGFQVVFNIINQRRRSIIEKAAQKGYGIIARMPFQFGLLTGKFDRNTRFVKEDHRHFRLKPEVLERSLKELENVLPLCEKYQISPAQFALSFILSFPEISTVIPGIKTEAQAVENSTGIRQLEEADKKFLMKLYDTQLHNLLDFMKIQES